MDLRETDVNWSGFVVAGVGFFLSRFSVALAVYESSFRFVVVGLLPLAAGLSLSAFGVALAVSNFDTWYVRTVTKWFLVGIGVMVSLVLLSLLGQSTALMSIETLRENLHFVNFLVGGGIGGVLLGLRTAERRGQRTTLQNQASRLITLNRILRHEVLNAVAVILGHVDHMSDQEAPETDRRTLSVMRERAKHIQETIDEVKYLTESPESRTNSLSEVSLATYLDACIEHARTTYPDAIVEYDRDEDVNILANPMLGSVFDHLVDNAVVHNDASTPEVAVAVETSEHSATVRVADNGPGLPHRQQAILEGNEIADYDDPTTGFGLNVVRLLVEQYRGDVRVADTGPDGTTIEVELLRASADRDQLDDSEEFYGMPPARLLKAVSAALVAGATMGVAMQYGAGIMPVIGSLYGVGSATVGWITHLFHSVVFGIIFASLYTRVRAREFVSGLPGAVGVASAFGLFLWFFAAGIVMPLWLMLVDRAYPFPNLTVPTLVGHVLWGVVVGAVFYYLCD